jgi:hypothetical protein
MKVRHKIGHPHFAIELDVRVERGDLPQKAQRLLDLRLGRMAQANDVLLFNQAIILEGEFEVLDCEVNKGR